MSDRILIVADTNLLTPSFARRYLAGLACEFDFRLGIVPTLEEETPRALRHELFRRESQRLQRVGAPDEAFWRLDGRSLDAAGGWLPSVADVADSPFVRCCATLEERYRSRRYLLGPLASAVTDPQAGTRAADQRILAESIAADADVVLTNNMAAISHARVNDFARSLGRNGDLLQPPGIAFSEMLRPEENASRVALAAFALSIADAPRDAQSERRSLEQFLHFAQIATGRPATVARNFLPSLTPDEFDALLGEARTKSAEPSFRLVRQAEARMRRIVREGASTHPRRSAD